MFGFKVICWALLFIFKLRFPPGVSIATVITSVNLKQIHEFYQLLIVSVNSGKTRYCRNLSQTL
jgi:hypothetical protein